MPVSLFLPKNPPFPPIKTTPYPPTQVRAVLTEISDALASTPHVAAHVAAQHPTAGVGILKRACIFPFSADKVHIVGVRDYTWYCILHLRQVIPVTIIDDKTNGLLLLKFIK